MSYENPPLRELYSAVIEEGESLDDVLEHYGTPRHSGRYPWGSGKDPYQHSGDFLARVNSLSSQGLSEKRNCGADGA